MYILTVLFGLTLVCSYADATLPHLVSMFTTSDMKITSCNMIST